MKEKTQSCDALANDIARLVRAVLRNGGGEWMEFLRVCLGTYLGC